jgi:hypothetical protein
MVSSSKLLVFVCAGIFLGACEEQPSSEATAPTDEPSAVVPAEVTPDLQLAMTATTLGDPLPRLSATEFQRFSAGQAVLVEVEEADEGLGPASSFLRDLPQRPGRRHDRAAGNALRAKGQWSV